MPTLRPALAAPSAPHAAGPVQRATVTLLASAVLFGAMAIGARLCSARIPGPQVALVRFAFGALAVAAAVLTGRARLRPRRWGWLLARGLFGGLAVLSYFSCIQHVGVGVATLLNYTAPVWSLLLGWALLGERPRAGAVLALVLTLVGVALVAGADVAPGAGIWLLVGELSAVASAIAVTSIRAVRRPSPDGLPSEGSWTVFASFTTLGVLATLPFAAPRWIAPTAREWALLSAVALVSILAQLLMTRALQHVTAAGSGIIHQLTVVVAMLGGVLFFDERLSGRGIAGSVVTIAGVVWIVLSQGQRTPAPPTPSSGSSPPALPKARVGR